MRRRSPFERLAPRLLQLATPIMFVAVLVYFGAQSEVFLSPESLANIIKQASFIGIAAVGITFVLLTAGIDLSVGSVMYLAPLIAGWVMREFGVPVPVALVVALAAGALMGAVNAAGVVWLRIVPFVVTLSTLFLFRGAGTFITSSRQLDFPREVLDFGLSAPLGVPLPIWIFAGVTLVAWVVLNRTTFGRQVYAVGNDAEAARKAGIAVGWVRARVYVISSTCAALAGFVLIAQIGRLDQAFGEGREFDVIAAAVLGGVSLFGGIGTAFSAVIGATLIQTVKAGLVFTGVGLYVQPIVQGSIIFLAVLFDSLRIMALRRLNRRVIRSES